MLSGIDYRETDTQLSTAIPKRKRMWTANLQSRHRYLILSENVRVLDSDYPLLGHWTVGTGQVEPEALDLDADGATAQVVLRRGLTEFQMLEPPTESTRGRVCHRGTLVR